MARPNPPVNGQILYEARLDLGLTQLQVTELTRQQGWEVNDSNLSKMERGDVRRPTPRTRKVLLKVLQLTPERMYAPCRICKQEWSADCLKHPAPADDQHGTAGDEAAEETGEQREQQPSAA
jgi:transcriptional regulator with XRE-family HTH domain